jgi:hypothetical protein
MTMPNPPVLPATPASTADAATVAAWWQRCDVLLRLYQQAVYVEVNSLSTEAQNARAVAEHEVAVAGQAAAAAQTAAAQAIALPPTLWTDAELIRMFMAQAVESGLRGAAVLSEARTQLAAYRKATAPIFVMPA